MSDVLTVESHAGPYRVVFDENALEALDAGVAGGAHFIVDERITDLYGARMANILASPSVLSIAATEQDKSLDRFTAYVEHLVTHGLRRDQMLVAIGGGIIQDITCFLAATMLRGVAWRFVPTTLLAQADSCIGSKSSINSGAAKNILGTFTPPRRIDLSTEFLNTLDERDVRSGVGEILKVHAIDGPEAFDRLAADYQRLFEDRETMAAYIRRSLDIKKAYIERDEFDQGPRNIFNYGHSFGHAIESLTDYTVPHGIAVSFGMDMANYFSVKMGLLNPQIREEIRELLQQIWEGYDIRHLDVSQFSSALAKDKKNVGQELRLILCKGYGKVFKTPVKNDDQLHDWLSEYFNQELN